MADPFAMALATLFASPMAGWADYTPPGGVTLRVRIVRDQGSEEVAFGQGIALLDTNKVQLQRSDVSVRPVGGGALIILTLDDAGNIIAQEPFVLQGDGELDVEGVTWRCALEPA